MSIDRRETAGGKVRWRVRWRDEQGKQHARHFERKVDAKRFEDELTAAVVTGYYVDPRAGRITFGVYADAWAARQIWETTTRQSFASVMKAVTFRDVPLRALRRSHVEAWVKSQASEYAASTVHTRVMNVRSVLRAAVLDKLIPEDPSAGVVLPRRRRSEHAMMIPTPGEVRKLLAAADPYFETFLALCAFAGLRRGEATAVKVEDVNFLGRALHVRRQTQRGEVRPPKYGSERAVYLPDDLVTLLSRHVGQGVHEDGWLFIGGNGEPAGENWGAHQFRRVQAVAGLQGLGLHSLRHFYASGLIAAGCDVVTVQRAMGHASATTTLNTYSHLWPTAEDRTRAAARSIMQQVAHGEDQMRTPLGQDQDESRSG